MALNKLASAAGVFLMPFVLIPLLGLFGGVVFCAILCMLCGVLIERSVPSMVRCSPLRHVPRFLLLLAAFLLLFWNPHAYFPQPGEVMVDIIAGKGSVVIVVDVPEHETRKIILDGLYALNGTGRGLRVQHHQGWIPLFFHPEPDRIMHIGMASGITSAAILDYPVRELLAVEVVPEVVEMARLHFADFNRAVFTDPRSRVLVNDGRHALRSTPEPLDLVICDLMFPGQDSASFLYSHDFFRNVQARLQPDGVFFLWLPAYQLDVRLADMIIHAMLEVFPNVLLVRGNFDPIQPVIGLVASGQPFDLTDAALARRIEAFQAQGLHERSPLFRSVNHARLMIMGDMRAHAKRFGCYGLTTDDRPAFAFAAAGGIPQARSLVGMALLDYFGFEIYSETYPSCKTDAEYSHMDAAIRAGNYYYAASTARMAGEYAYRDANEQMAINQYQISLSHMRIARELLVDAALMPSDLW